MKKVRHKDIENLIFTFIDISGMRLAYLPFSEEHMKIKINTIYIEVTILCQEYETSDVATINNMCKDIEDITFGNIKKVNEKKRIYSNQIEVKLYFSNGYKLIEE